MLLVRKSTKQISGAGGLFDAAIQLFTKVDPKLKIKQRDLTLVFSSGAQFQATYMDKPADRYNIQGKEFSALLLDEAQQLSLENVLYCASRLRSTMVDYPLRMLATCNPDYDSFLRPWVEPYLDERGIPIPVVDNNYRKRYFTNTSTGLLWYDTLEEAQKVHGTKADAGIKSFKFVPATALDNTVLLKNNPEYLSTLRALPRVEMERLLLGSWYARESASGYFKREYIELVDHYNIKAIKRVRAWDLAFSKPSEVRPDVDATAGVLMSKDKQGIYTVEDVAIIRERVLEVESLIFKTAEDDGRDVTISLPLDPGATGGAYCRDLAKRLSERGFHVKLTRPEKGKLQRFLPFASVAEARFVHFVRADWNDKVFAEMESMDFTNRTHDDVADACSDAFYHLNRDMQLPTFTLPDLSSPSLTSQFNIPTSGITLPKSGITLP